MWIQQLLGLSSMSVRWPGCALGSQAWILIAMFQLATDLPACEALGPGPEFRLLPRPSPRPPRLWSLRSGQPARIPAPVWSPRPARVERSHGQMPSPRAKRAHRPREQVAALGPKAGLAKPPAAAKPGPSLGPSPSAPSPPGGSGAPTDRQALLRRGRRQLPAVFSSFDVHPRGGRPTTEAEFIAWGPTGEEEALAANTAPDGPTTVSYFQTRKTTAATASAATATTATAMTLQTKGVTAPLDPRSRIPAGLSTTEPATSPSRDSGKDTKPPRILGETSGLAVHQIVTITVSLIMVIAALITTLVLKNCCAQSGNPRRNGRPRKLDQQEESCQNLTDFPPARVPSSLDIFTAYSEGLQCSHECVRASVPTYADETLRSVGEYKSTFNGNRPPSSDRHLIPVAFVSEKWFEISC
ncbi:adherens junction-associated protein 1 [Eptesicus fuscus]|uniref:adherens junction-associated protein 1 n=1 Tax=Eptesicus fuscus TaxID=29078 RepID=UPI0024047282|nr:adherens junction-associated protein 1 [Eptesicus fuscus]